MRLALEKVAQEKPDKTWSDPQERAKEVEEALFNLYGEPASLPYNMQVVGWGCIVILGGSAQALVNTDLLHRIRQILCYM